MSELGSLLGYLAIQIGGARHGCAAGLAMERRRDAGAVGQPDRRRDLRRALPRRAGRLRDRSQRQRRTANRAHRRHAAAGRRAAPGAAARLRRQPGPRTDVRVFRVILADRTPAILVVATEPAGAGLPLDERVRRLCIGIEEPIALFAPDGELIHATAGETQLLGLKSIAALGAGELAERALLEGRAAGASHLGAISVRTHRLRSIGGAACGVCAGRGSREARRRRGRARSSRSSMRPRRSPNRQA